MNTICQQISRIFILLCVFSSLNLQSQMYINGSFAIAGSGAIFGNVEFGPDADVHVYNGSELHILGTSTVVHPSAEFTAPVSPTGKFVYRGAVQQTINGGNSEAIGGAQPSLINIEINNVHGVALTGSNTRLVGGVEFTNGHLFLGSQNLELSSNSTISNATDSRYVVTNGTGFLAKEDIVLNTAFTFPIGRATSDFTPATLTPTATDNFFVQVKNYTESASDEFVTTDGIDRTWNIYSTSGSGTNIILQHNTSTNGSNYADVGAFVTQYQGIQWVSSAQQSQGVWQLGTGANTTDAAGSIVGSRVHNRDYATTATSAGSIAAFFSKSSDELTPLPIALLDFTANKKGESQALLTWSTTSEINSSHFEVEVSSNNGQSWTKIGEVKAQGMSYELNNYQLVHKNPTFGINYYRLNLVDLDGASLISPIRMLQFGHSINALNNIDIFPNPVKDVITIRTENKNYNYFLINKEGRVLAQFQHTNQSNEFLVDLSQYANGVYYIKANSKNGDVKVFKIVLNK